METWSYGCLHLVYWFWLAWRYEDGKYEGYGNDSYSTKDNAFIGKWEWDDKRKVIVFTNDKLFKDGKETKMNRPTMTMEVLNFGDGQLFLRDIETWSEFRYENMDEQWSFWDMENKLTAFMASLFLFVFSCFSINDISS